MKPLRWIPTIAYAGLIFYMSSRPWSGVTLFPFADKIIHLFMYGILGALCLWSLAGTTLGARFAILPLAVLMATLYGVTDELHQMFVPGRTAAVGDVAADFAGALAGALIAAYMMKIIGRTNEGDE